MTVLLLLLIYMELPHEGDRITTTIRRAVTAVAALAANYYFLG